MILQTIFLIYMIVIISLGYYLNEIDDYSIYHPDEY